MPKLLPISPTDESSVCSHSLCRKLSLDSNKKKVSSIKVDRLMWGIQPTHLDNFLSNRHQMFREVLKPMSPVSFKSNYDNSLNKSKASKSPYLKHMKSLREKELFLLKTGLITDPSGIDDGNLKKEMTIQNQLQSIVSPINVKKSKHKKVGNIINKREKNNNTSNSSLWSSESTLDSNISTGLHADTLSYLVANSSNQWWRNDRADSSGFSVNSGNTACSGGSEYGIFEAELVSLNGDDELISNDSDSIRH